MYCPNDDCPDFVAYGVRGEYRDGVTTCPKCKALLLSGSPATLHQPERGEGEPLVPVGSFEYEHEANLAVSFLAANGILAIIASDDCGRTDPILGVVTGGLHLMVPESRAEEAVGLLELGQPTGDGNGV